MLSNKEKEDKLRNSTHKSLFYALCGGHVLMCNQLKTGKPKFSKLLKPKDECLQG